MAQRVSFESALTPSQETVAPAMSHPDMDAKVLCNRAEWAAIPQRFGLPQPFLPLVQPGERRTAQSVERPPASTSRLSHEVGPGLRAAGTRMLADWLQQLSW